LKDYYDEVFTKPKRKYDLGDICHDWKTATKGKAPPWDGDTDHPYDERHAKVWKKHCTRDLEVENTNPDGTGRGKTVKAELEEWIVAAITGGKQIVYSYVQKNLGTIEMSKREFDIWRAEREPKDGSGSVWKITVTGPGW
jgi:hypothetical protein